MEKFIKFKGDWIKIDYIVQHNTAYFLGLILCMKNTHIYMYMKCTCIQRIPLKYPSLLLGAGEKQTKRHRLGTQLSQICILVLSFPSCVTVCKSLNFFVSLSVLISVTSITRSLYYLKSCGQGWAHSRKVGSCEDCMLSMEGERKNEIHGGSVPASSQCTQTNPYQPVHSSLTPLKIRVNLLEY